MIVYAESSAILSWLLAEPRQQEVLSVLVQAEFVVASDLTLIECDRVLHRAVALGSLSPAQATRLAGLLRQAASKWISLRITEGVVERARGPFPGEPIRALDALRLASAWLTASVLAEADTAILALDDRVRRCARELGLRVLPEA